MAKNKSKNGYAVDSRLIKEIHKILMKEEEGEQKNLGRLRTSQNWVGGSSILEAIYIPPPYNEVEECLKDFDEFISNNDIDTPDLVKLAILHYQFESIHPFIGGNGRIGRMIIPLYLQSKGILDKPCLYISEYLEKNKDKYFEMFDKVRTNSDIIGWIRFFLEAIIETSKDTKEKFKRLIKLNEEMENVIVHTPVKPENARKLIEVLYEEPMIDKIKLGNLSGIKQGTMRTIINSLIDKEIVIKTKGYNKNIILVFKKYTDIFFRNIDI